MASTIPRVPRAQPPPSAALPALPALPVPKTRSLSGDDHDSPHHRRGSTASLASLRPVAANGSKKSAIPSRSVTGSGLPAPKSAKAYSTPSVPTLGSPEPPVPGSPSAGATAGSGVPARSIRKTASIGSFPLPPKGTPRVSSLPPSPLSASQSPNEPVTGQTQSGGARRDSSKHRSADASLRKPKTRSSGYGVRPRISHPGTVGSPSLLNGTGDSAMIAGGGDGMRASDGLLSIPSPPQSRSSSAEGSYANDPAAIEDIPEEPQSRGRSRVHSKSLDGQRDSLGKDSKGNVIVSVRVRPDAGGDAQADGEWMVDGRRSLISYKGREAGDYRYDNVFSPLDHNARVYDNAAKRLVRRVMEGYHGTVFAYGMTGTGKTFSMQGTANSPGVIPLAITDIFSYIRENPEREFLLRVSYLEIYNEKIYDLLTQTTPGQTQQEEIKLREDSKRGVYATPLKEEIVQSPNQLLRVIARGDLARRTGSTQFNARSSRSHAVVQIVVESRERTQSHGEYFKKESRRMDKVMPGGVLVSTLSLIDLAGSEKAAENKERRTEGAHINKSLLTLGTVIARLSGDDEKDDKDGAKTAEKDSKGLKHLPYRDSKLTRLLQPALSGNSLVSILCTIQLSSSGSSAAHASSHTGETLNTLKFASRAKNNIVSRAKRNESNLNPGDPNSRALLDRYRLEIQDLRSQLEAQNKAKEEADEVEELKNDRKVEEELERQEQNRHEEQMLEMQLARTALKERISHLNRLILSSKSLGVNSGRFSNTSLPFDPRTSVLSLSQAEYGRPVSVRSRASAHDLQRDSTATLDMPASDERTESGAPPGGDTPPLEEEDDEEGDDPRCDDGDGNASLSQQNRMLQADLADKNRYIATLEKRLLQARRTSHSRVSMHFASRVGVPEEGSLESLLRDRDREIEELRAKLDDQMRMVTALRSAARKRDMLENRKSHATTTSEETARPSTPGADSVADLTTLPFRRHNSSRTSRQSSRASNGGGAASSAGHRSNLSLVSTGRESSASAAAFPKTPLSPMALLSPGHSSSNSRESNGEKTSHSIKRRKSVDEMTQLLDQMIQDKVESGHVVRGERGSLRVRRDTMLAQIKDDPSGESDGEVSQPEDTKNGGSGGGGGDGGGSGGGGGDAVVASESAW